MKWLACLGGSLLDVSMLRPLASSTRLLLAWLLFTLGSSAQQHIDAIIRARAASLPRSEFKPAEKDGFAVIQRLPTPAQPITDPQDGRLCTAMVIRTPDTIGGPVLMMYLKMNEAHEAGERFNAWLMPLVPEADKEPEENRVWGNYDDYKALAFRTFKERFPNNTHVLLERARLEPSTDYIVAFSSTKAVLPNFGVALTVHSKEGYKTYGSLPLGVHNDSFEDPPAGRPETEAAALAGIIADYFRGGQDKEGLSALEEGARAYYEDGGEFPLLYRKLILEAEKPGSNSSPTWDAELWDWIFRHAREKSYDFEAEISADQMIQRQLRRNRSAKLIDALRFMSKLLYNTGLSQTAARYPDLGPGLDAFPDARKRDIPKELPNGMPWISADNFVFLERSFGRRPARLLDAHTQKYALNGNWKEALEWQLWAKECVEDNLKENADKPDPLIEDLWIGTIWRIALILTDMGFYEAADEQYEALIARRWEAPHAFLNKSHARLRHLEMQMLIDPAKKGLLPELEEIVAGLNERRQMPPHLPPWIDCLRARCLVAEGKDEEAMRLLEPAAAQDALQALRLKVLLDSAKGKAKAAELAKIFALYQEIGMSREESEIYSAAAQQAEHEGRVAEANAMHLATVQSAQGFSLYPEWRLGYARLAASLARHGDSELARIWQKDAEAMLAETKRTPPRVKAQGTRILTEKLAIPPSNKPFTPAALVPAKAQLGKMENGARSIVVWLTNWNDTPVEGTLKFDGLPVDARYTEGRRTVDVTVSNKPGTASIEKLRLFPGLPITITLQPAEDAPLPGRVTVTWSSVGQADQSSVCEFTKDDQPIAMTVAADERLTQSFHGAKLRFNYHLGLKEDERAAVRAISSKPARIEMLVGSNIPLFVDDQGNGSVEEPGDVLFAHHTPELLPSLGMGSDDYPIRLRIVPKEPLGKDGLEVTLQQQIGGNWTPFARCRIEL